jgi:hypothetical protein
MTDKVIGIYLIGGPPEIDGYKNAFAAEDLGGWPPPDELAAMPNPDVPGGAVVALPENVPNNARHLVTWYTKVRQSQIPDPPGENENFLRGATYQLKEEQ